MKRVLLSIMAASALVLTACSGGEAAESDATPSSTTTTTATTAVEKDVNDNGYEVSEFKPGDEALTPVDNIESVGIFRNTETGDYFFCNDGDATLEEGSPAAPDTCVGPLTYNEAQQAAKEWGDVFDARMSSLAENTSSATAPVPALEPAPQAAPTIVECLEGTPGPTLMSDGSKQYTDHCFYTNGGPEYLEAESQSGLSPEQDPSNIPYSEGGNCPAYRCGYGNDENGDPRPSNTEIQSWWSDCIATNSAEYCRANDPYQ